MFFVAIEHKFQGTLKKYCDCQPGQGTGLKLQVPEAPDPFPAANILLLMKRAGVRGNSSNSNGCLRKRE